MSHSAAEVLDLTHDHALPFRLQFDDHSWRQHLNSLKPLGLAILLNTCNMDTQEHYMQFCCHVTCEALYNENLVPVTNRRYVLSFLILQFLKDSSDIILFDFSLRLNFEIIVSLKLFAYVTRCLCELAKQIGFQDQAQKIFQLEQQLSTFRHVASIIIINLIFRILYCIIILIFVKISKRIHTHTHTYTSIY